jgi:hypothetical protein
MSTRGGTEERMALPMQRSRDRSLAFAIAWTCLLGFALFHRGRLTSTDEVSVFEATMAQSFARELGPENIHVAHLVIDAGVDTERVRGMIAKAQGREVAEIAPDVLMKPDSVANAYWMLQQQPRDSWTFELEIRPFGEKW